MHPEQLAEIALKTIDGVGNPAQQWPEWTGYAFHIRRRLTEVEQETIGPAVDCRGTEEFSRRYYAVVRQLPDAAKRLAQQEMMATV